MTFPRVPNIFNVFTKSQSALILHTLHPAVHDTEVSGHCLVSGYSTHKPFTSTQDVEHLLQDFIFF